MKTLRDLEVCVNRFDGNEAFRTKLVTLPAGTQVVRWYVHGEEVLLICGSNWFFVASDEWIEKNIGGERWETSRSGYGE